MSVTADVLIREVVAVCGELHHCDAGRARTAWNVLRERALDSKGDTNLLGEIIDDCIEQLDEAWLAEVEAGHLVTAERVNNLAGYLNDLR